jgi:hypothetical protein
MKRIISTLSIIAALLCCSVVAQAQLAGNVRYLNPVFPYGTVTVDSNVVYGTNWSIIRVPVTGRTFKQPLRCNIHQPAGDAETKRPLVIYLPTGNFLPQSVTQSPSGIKEDSTVSEMCRRFASMGYVAAACEYRLGWNPADTAQLGRTSTLINAAYRGLQDARTAIRYFKANATQWKVDTNKIMVIGQGTGGYIALAAATLSNYLEIINVTSPANKFIDTRTTPAQPMVIERIPNGPYVAGDIEGKVVGIVPAGTVPPAGDTLCAPNWVNNRSDFQLCVNLGGALGDISWIDSASVPTLSFQYPFDPFAPYLDEVLRVPVAPGVAYPVVRVQGSDPIQRRFDALGLNTRFDAVRAQYDPYKATYASRVSGGVVRGLFPVLGDTTSDSSPWDYWASTNTYNAQGLRGNPRMTRAKAIGYIDSIIITVAPRACIALNLPCRGIVTGTEELLQENAAKLVIAPNPARNVINFESEATNPIQAIEIYDLSGRLVQQIRSINAPTYQLERKNLATGLYIAKVKFEGGILARRIVFE